LLCESSQSYTFVTTGGTFSNTLLRSLNPTVHHDSFL
jgi:hypothetical protein